MIVVYAGSFNPVTLAHEMIATSVSAKLDAKILFVPVSDMYNKPGLAKFNFRKDMLDIICQKYPNMDVSDIEYHLALKIGRQPKTYETLQELKKIYDEEIGLLIGTDNFYDLKNWYRFNDLISEFYIVVYPRKGMDNEFMNSALYQKYENQFKIVEGIEQSDISASKVRDNIKNNTSNEDMLDSDVIRYITDNNELIGY